MSQSTLFPDADNEFTPTGLSDKRRRYALVQRLPGGDWWSSSNTAREGEKGLTAADAKEMRKGQAELVSIIPALPLPPSSMPTLGDLQLEGRKEPRSRFKPLYIHPRNVSSGTFLDYGPHASFAPAFDSEGAEVGREGLGQMLMGRLERRKVKEARQKLLARLKVHRMGGLRMADVTEIDAPHEQDREAVETLLKSLFPDEKMDGVKAALHAVEVEDGVASLLERNGRALELLNLLQTVRLRTGNTPVKEGSEEWNVGTYSALIVIDLVIQTFCSQRSYELPYAARLTAASVIQSFRHRACISSINYPTPFSRTYTTRHSPHWRRPRVARYAGRVTQNRSP